MGRKGSHQSLGTAEFIYPISMKTHKKHYIESSTTDDLLRSNTITVTAAPGEWLAAGYSGEGMAHAFLSGRALALHVLDRKDEAKDWLPEGMALSQSPGPNSSCRVALGKALLSHNWPCGLARLASACAATCGE